MLMPTLGSGLTTNDPPPLTPAILFAALLQQDAADIAPQLLPPPPVTDQQIAELASEMDFVRIEDNPSLIAGDKLIAKATKTTKSLDKWVEEPKKTLNSLKNAVAQQATVKALPLQAGLTRLKEEKKAYEAAVARANQEAAAAVQSGEVESWQVQMTALPVSGEASTRNLPPSVVIKDPAKTLAWILADMENRGDMVEFRLPIFNAKARSLGKKLEEMIPGIEVVINTTVSVR